MPAVKLGDVAVEARELYKGDKTGCPIVGLEHITPEEVTLSNWSIDTENTFTKMFRKDDMLFGRRRAYLRKAAIAPFDGICSGDITVIRAKSDKMLPMLLPFVIQNEDFFEYAVGKSAGSLSPRVKWEHLKNYTFNLPSLEKQKELADLLWSIHDSRKAYQDLLRETDELIKAQFIEMFGDPEENPMGWPIRKLSEVAKVDGTMTKEYEKYAEYPHIGIDSIEKNTGILSGYRTVREDNIISPKYHFGPQHILYSKIRPALNKVAIPEFEGLCSADCYPLLPIGGWCERKFLAHVLRSDFFLNYILSYSGRSQMPKVNRKQLGGFTFPCPPMELQNRFLILTEQSDKSKFELKQAIKSVDNLVRSLVQKELKFTVEDSGEI
ncbi:MAG: restriction endonuclease subunit S [Lachnospiraceae bacterium]|nr:restriction endonuclease subunit S [Lachnospiraceae bacterium]